MGMDILQLLFKDGDIPMDPATPAYFGGQPAAIGANGATLAIAEDAKYIGMMKNSSYEDQKNGNVTIVHGGKVVFINGSNEIDSVINGATVEGAPYDTTLTYGAGDYLWIQATTGLWKNTGTAGREKGIVIKPATGTDGNMEAYMFSVK